jgi:hypothetical protein
MFDLVKEVICRINSEMVCPPSSAALEEKVLELLREELSTRTAVCALIGANYKPELERQVGGLRVNNTDTAHLIEELEANPSLRMYELASEVISRIDSEMRRSPSSIGWEQRVLELLREELSTRVRSALQQATSKMGP